jgi:hypothetical protein
MSLEGISTTETQMNPLTDLGDGLKVTVSPGGIAANLYDERHGLVCAIRWPEALALCNWIKANAPAARMSPQGIVEEVAQKLLDFHLGKGPQPDWNDLFQGFCAAQQLLKTHES